MPIIEHLPLPQIRKSPSYSETRRGLLPMGTQVGKRDIRLGAKVINVFPGQSIQKAIDTLDKDDGGVVFLKTGTHILSGNISGKAKVSIVGEGRDITIIDCGSTSRGLDYTGTSSVILENFVLADFTLKDSDNTAGIDIDFCDFWRMENVRVTSCDKVGIQITSSQEFILNNVRSDNNTTIGVDVTGNSATRVMKNFSFLNVMSDNNTTDGFDFTSTTAGIINFSLMQCTADTNGEIGFDFNGGGGSEATDASLVSCKAESNTGDGFNLQILNLTLLGCSSDSNGGDGFDLTYKTNLIGCVSRSNTGVDIRDSNANGLPSSNIVGCSVTQSSSTNPTDRFVLDADNRINLDNIVGGGIIHHRRIISMKNTSAATMSQGQVVTLKAVASGDEVTLTTAQGDDLVFGILIDASSFNNNYSSFLVEGFTDKLKVDGTIDISVGDPLGCFTTAGIAMKAAAGDMFFAYALENYTTDDSSGIIDALLVSPRKL